LIQDFFLHHNNSFVRNQIKIPNAANSGFLVQALLFHLKAFALMQLNELQLLADHLLPY